MRRRTAIASLATAAVPAFAGCSTCGETWTGVGWAVSPTELRRTSDGWAVEADVSVTFDFGREGRGVYDATLAAFAEDGQVVGRTDLGNLVWEDVPEEARTETDCGDHGTLVRTASIGAEAFPRWIGLRYSNATDAIGNSRSAVRYDGTPSDDATADGYRPVDVTESVGEDPPLPEDIDERVQFQRSPPACEEYPTADVTTRYGLSIQWVRQLPEEKFHPVLADVDISQERVRLDIGLRAWPRFRKLPCLSEEYVAEIETDALPDVVEVRHLSTEDEVVTSTSVRRVRSETS